MFEHRYLPHERVVHDMLPDDVRWHYDQAPPDLAHQMPGCPVSEYPHGVIRVSRPLGHHEMNAGHLEPFKPEKRSRPRPKLLQLAAPESLDETAAA